MTSQAELETPRPQPTGRQLVFFKPNSDLTSIKNSIKNTTGISTRDSREFQGNTKEMGDALTQGEAVYVERFKVAAVEPAKIGSAWQRFKPKTMFFKCGRSFTCAQSTICNNVMQFGRAKD